MRILYVCQDAGIPAFGRKGASTHIREVCRAWVNMGHRIHLVCADLGPDRDPTLDIECTTVPPLRHKLLGADLRGLLTDRRFARTLPRVAQAFRPDLIYERHSLYTGAATALAKRLGIGHILETNALLSDEQRDRLHHPRWAARRERRAFERTDCLITVSPQLAAACRAWGIPAEKIHTLPMAVDPGHFHPRPRDPAQRAQWGWTPEHTVVGYLGALTGWHRTDLLLGAAACIAERFPLMRLLFLGGSPHHTEKYRELAADMGLAERTLFLGSRPYREVPEILAEFDLGVVPGAHQWSTPTKMFEYGAMGIPFIAPGTENIRAVMDDHVTCRLFEAGEQGALAEALAQLLGDAEARRRLSEGGLARVLERHTWERHAEALLELGQAQIEARR
ncbi:glycosyltransferase family 4 protein [Candidatus Sumerlaeota bacterium]|nr:glycosyltransferase family 4 protein [Candidatus Sumerlaeota bacterium]